MTHYPQQGQQPMTYPSQPAAPRSAGKRPRGWHVAAALTLGLFVVWFVVAMLAATCPPPPKPVSSSSGAGGTSLTRADADKACASAAYLTATEKQRCAALKSGASDPCAYAISDAAHALCDLRDIWENAPTAPAKKPSPVCGAATGSLSSILMLGQLIGIIVTGILGWKRRKTYTAYRRSLFAVDDYERRVPPGTEGYVDLATHQMAAQAAANASTEMFMNRSYWFAPSGAETDARIDAIRATGARATNAAQQIQMSQYAGDEPMDDLAAPDLGGDGDTTSDTPTDADDDWMSGVDSNDSDW